MPVSSPAPWRGIAFLVAAVACFAALDTLTKIVGAAVPLVMVLWVRYMAQAVLTGAVLLPSRGRALLRTRHPWRQAARALLLLLSSVSAFASLRVLPVGEFTAVVMLTPLGLTLVSAVALGEHVPPARWAFLLLGFLGALVVIRPGADFHPAMLLPLGCVVTNIGYTLMTRALARADGAGTTHFYTGCVAATVLSLALPFVWVTLPSALLWVQLAGIALASTTGHLFLIFAYKRAPVSTLTPFLYLQIAFALVGGWLVFAYLPDAWALAGVAAIAVSGIGGTAVGASVRRVSMQRPAG